MNNAPPRRLDDDVLLFIYRETAERRGPTTITSFISRAVSRLETRQLVRRTGWSQVELTAAGLAEAASLAKENA